VLRKSPLIVALAAMLSLLFNCSNPVDEPLRWTSVAEIPVTNQKFNLKEQLTEDNLVKNDSMKVVDPDTTKLGDTLRFVQKSADTANIEVHEDTIKKQTYQAVLGLIPLSNTKPILDTIQLPGAVGNFLTSIPMTLDKVYEVTFYDTTTNILSITASNLSSSSLTNVAVGIAGVDTQTISTLGANSSDTFKLQVRGTSIGHSIDVMISGSSPDASAKELVLAFSLNGLLGSRCKVEDSLVTFNQVFNGTYDITDTIAMDYIDIASGFFEYTVNNYTNLELSFGVEHQHLWTTAYCQENHFEKVDDLLKSKVLDSVVSYSGDKILQVGVSITPNTNKRIARPNISANRLFTTWDTTRNQTVTKIEYTVATNPPKGEIVTLSATDSLSFTVSYGDFKFKEFLGTVMEPYVRNGDTQKVAINLPEPWNQSMKDSLRGNFFFTNVDVYVHSTAKMSDRSFIDTMNVSFTALPLNVNNVRDSTETKFLHVVNDTTYHRNFDITNVTNQFPDTVIINTTVRIPKGTRMRVCNDLSTDDYEMYNKYIGQMTTQILTNYELSPTLDWTVTDTTNLDLGSNTFPIDEMFRFVKKLEKRRAVMNFKIFNSSNLNMYLFALISPESRIHTLDSMSTNDFFKLLSNKDAAEAQGYVNFLGTNGVYIPKRNLLDTSGVELNDAQIDTILSSDTCSWRWATKFVPQGQDAMSDTDFVEIHSKLIFEGVNSTDSLTIW
jgi:hypothetical protein